MRTALIDADTIIYAAGRKVEKIVEWGEDIIHPVTGKIIKGEKTVLLELKVTRVDEETSEVKIVGSKVKLKVGQVLESVPKKASLWESLKNKG